jgi:hypothetical protein
LLNAEDANLCLVLGLPSKFLCDTKIFQDYPRYCPYLVTLATLQGPLEPFDDSMPELLNKAGVHSHKVLLFSNDLVLLWYLHIVDDMIYQ